jgi:hypothetical protein
MTRWSKWRPFPNPKLGEYLTAPFGPGVYELRNNKTGQLVLFGQGKNVANRMTSLFPKPVGAGTRNNSDKSRYIQRNLSNIEYRTYPCAARAQAVEFERSLKTNKNAYKFSS